jgi:hypothetical protein
MINKPFLNFTTIGIGLLGTLQLGSAGIYLISFVGAGSDMMDLLYAVCLCSSGLMFFGFYFILKFIREYLVKNGYEMEETY